MALTINNLISDPFGFPAFAGGGPRLLAYATPDDIDVGEGICPFSVGNWDLAHDT
ncbi:MAG: calcium-binding protein, partial [Oscillatoriales cyanobacterium RU_3_3]|nr:calcium-binding protein [Oscillatoriales cyanobacterium RU_3_3]